MAGGFLFCPCHLPLTLGLLATVLAGTTLGVVVREHVVIAAAVTSVAWVLATWHGLRLLRPRARRASTERGDRCERGA